MTGNDTHSPNPVQARPPMLPPSAAERGRRNLALLIGVTVAVLVFGLVVFGWMYWLVPTQ